MPEKPATRTIHERMVAILTEMPAIGKNQKNEQQGFMFRGHDDVLNALNPLLATHGVFVVPDVLERITSQRTTSRGSVMYEVSLHVKFTFWCIQGSSVEASSWGEGTDMGDKATSKAHTMAFKTALNQAFAISNAETDDPDRQSAPESKTAKPKFPDPTKNGKPDEEAVKLANELLELVGQIGDSNGTKAELVPATQLLIGKHAGDKAWLKRQINAAKETLNAAIPF